MFGLGYCLSRFRALPAYNPQPRAIFAQIKDPETGIILRGEITFMQMRFNQQVIASITFLDDKGFPAKVDPESIKWKSSDDSIVSVTPAPNDKTQAVIRSFRQEGVAAVSVEADGDPSSEVQKIVLSGDVNVLPRNAVGGSVTFGQTSDANDDEPAPTTPQPTQPTPEPKQPAQAPAQADAEIASRPINTETPPTQAPPASFDTIGLDAASEVSETSEPGEISDVADVTDTPLNPPPMDIPSLNIQSGGNVTAATEKDARETEGDSTV